MNKHFKSALWALGLFLFLTPSVYSQDDGVVLDDGVVSPAPVQSVPQPQINRPSPNTSQGSNTGTPQPMPFARPSLPGQPIEPPSVGLGSSNVPESSNIETFGGSEDEDEFGSSGGVKNFESGDQIKVGKEMPAGVSGVYTISKGDTLWDICMKLLDNPWYWPKLWSMNEYITNPHFIFPGNQLRFFSGSQTSLPRMEFVDVNQAQSKTVANAPATVSKESETLLEQGIHLRTTSKDMVVRPVSFISENAPKTVGRILSSEVSRMELMFNDIIYLKMKKPSAVNVGDRFYVIEKKQKIKNVENKKNLGFVYTKNAVIEVTRRLDKTIEARIIDGDDSVRRGYDLIPYEPFLRKITPAPYPKAFSAKVIGAESEFIMSNHQTYVFINKGLSEGLQPGHQLFVTKKGDEVLLGNEKHMPETFKGKMVVVEATSHTATGYLTDIVDGIEVGDQVRSLVQ